MTTSKLPVWKVYFDGNFWGYSGRNRAGKEISTNIQFILNDKKCNIPCIYSCSKGLVIDFCFQIPIDDIRNFVNKWDLSAENDGFNFTNEQQMLAESESSMAINISPDIIINGKLISSSRGCGLSWNPCFPKLNGREAEGALKKYGLDPDCGWVVLRSAFPWHTTRKPQISSLNVTIKNDPITMFGPHFCAPTPGECIDFVHPITNVQHTLTTQEYVQQEMMANQSVDGIYCFPTHYTAMRYTLQPDISSNSFSIHDVSDGDHPRKKVIEPNESQSSAACCGFGVIGDTDGPTAIVFGGSEHEKLRVARSALHFNPIDTVEWKMVFYEKPYDDVTVKIL